MGKKKGGPKNQEEAIVQHYVPQFLLRNFLVPGEERLHCLNKRNLKIFNVSTRNAASEKHFCEYIDQKGRRICFEGYFRPWEHRASIIIHRILETRTLVTLLPEEKELLASFLFL